MFLGVKQEVGVTLKCLPRTFYCYVIDIHIVLKVHAV